LDSDEYDQEVSQELKAQEKNQINSNEGKKKRVKK